MLKWLSFSKVEERKWKDSLSTGVKKLIKFDAGTTSWYFLMKMFFFIQVPLSSSQAIRKEKPPARMQECSFVGCDFTSKVGWGWD
jgi:hypothetical protein